MMENTNYLNKMADFVSKTSQEAAKLQAEGFRDAMAKINTMASKDKAAAFDLLKRSRAVKTQAEAIALQDEAQVLMKNISKG